MIKSDLLHVCYKAIHNQILSQFLLASALIRKLTKTFISNSVYINHSAHPPSLPTHVLSSLHRGQSYFKALCSHIFKYTAFSELLLISYFTNKLPIIHILTLVRFSLQFHMSNNQVLKTKFIF